MPADNIEGFRADMIAVLKDVGATIYRWPGGNFLSGYEWRDGIGDLDQRPPRYDYAWNTVESNDMGTDEYMTWCRLLGSEPYLVVNTGFGDAYSAGQWVEYVNGSVDTPMGLLRAKNGHPQPYGVIYWGVGNEAYGEWQLGHMSGKHYVLKHNYFAEEMLSKDPTIKLIGSGATVGEQGSQSLLSLQSFAGGTPCSKSSETTAVDWMSTKPGSMLALESRMLFHARSTMKIASRRFRRIYDD